MSVNWLLLKNSLLVATGTTLLAAALGLFCALWATGMSKRRQHVFLALAGAAFCLPPFLVTNCWLHFLGNTGVWRSWLPFNIYSLAGATWILGLLNWPISFFAFWSAWRRLQTGQIECEPWLRGWSLFRYLLWPISRNPVRLALLLTFVLALNNFAVPAILQVKVYPAELWVSFSTNLDYGKAALIGIPLMIAPLLLLVGTRRVQIPWPATAATAEPALLRKQIGFGWFSAALMAGVFTIGVSLLLPLLQIALSAKTWSELPQVFRAEPVLVWNSFWIAATAAVLCLFVALFSRGSRWGVVAWLPLLIPGVLLGMALGAALNRPVLDLVYQSQAVIVFAWTVRYFGLAWNGLGRVLREQDRQLADAARLDGLRGWNLFRHVLWPQIAPIAGALGYLTFLLCLWDVETLILIYPPGGETLALRIFNLLHYGHAAQVNALCLLLLMIAVAPLPLWWMAKRLRGYLAPATALLCALLAGCGQPAERLHSKFFESVQVIGGRGTDSGHFNKPRSVAVDRQDNLYVVDMTGRVQKFTPEGKFVLSWQMPQTELGKPKGMCCDHDGNIIVLEPHYQRVNHFSTEGKLVTQWGSRGTNFGELILPRSVAVNSRGDVLVSEYTSVDRVQIFSLKTRKPTLIFGQPGNGPAEFNRAEGLGLDEQDRIYVADSCNHRVQVFAPDGKFIRLYGQAGGAVGELSYPYDVRVDHAGNQYVCEFGNSRIQIFDAQDKSIEIIGGAGAAPGKFNNPWSIALDSQGNLYVADAGNHRVQKLIRKKVIALNATPALAKNFARE